MLVIVKQLANHLRLACSLSAKDYKPHYIPLVRLRWLWLVLVVVSWLSVLLRFHYHFMRMNFFIRPMELVASKQNRSRKFNWTAPLMKNFLRIMQMMEMVPSIKSNESFCDGGRDQRLWRL